MVGKKARRENQGWTSINGNPASAMSRLWCPVTTHATSTWVDAVAKDVSNWLDFLHSMRGPRHLPLGRERVDTIIASEICTPNAAEVYFLHEAVSNRVAAGHSVMFLNNE